MKVAAIAALAFVASCSSGAAPLTDPPSTDGARAATSVKVEHLAGSVRIASDCTPTRGAAPCPSSPPPPGTTVRFADSQTNAAVDTAPNGDFRFDHPGVGAHELQVDAPGSAPKRALVDLSAQSTTVVLTIPADGGAVEVHVS